MQILTPNHGTEVGDPYGEVRGRIERDEGDGNSIGRPVSNNLDCWELLKTDPPIKDVKWTGPQHMYSTGLPDLASVGEDALNSRETLEPRKGECLEQGRGDLGVREGEKATSGI